MLLQNRTSIVRFFYSLYPNRTTGVKLFEESGQEFSFLKHLNRVNWAGF